MTDSASEKRDGLGGENIGEPLLDKTSALLAVFVPVTLVFVATSRPEEVGSPSFVIYSLSSALLLWVAFHRRSGPRRRAIGLTLALLGIQAAAVGLLGYVVGSFGAGFLAVMAAGVFLSVRAAVATLASSTAIMAAFAFLFAGEVLASPFETSAVDPAVLRNGLRYSFTYATIAGVVTIGASLMIQRLSRSLAESRRALQQAEESDAERRRLEEAMHHAQKLETLGRLAGGIAHDFNNMLTVILTSAVLIKRDPAEVDSLIDDLISATVRSSEMTKQLLAFGRTRAIGVVALDLHSVIERFLPLLGRLVRDDFGVKLDFAAEEHTVLADRILLEQILLNLVINAEQATAGPGTVVVSTSTDAPSGESGSWVCLRVVDEGGGMSEEVRDNVFEPLFSTKEGGGTGLGLATVKSAAKTCGGVVSVRSELGEGSVFSVFLPTVSGRTVTSFVPAAAPEAPPIDGPILVVDDDELVRASIIRILAAHGYGTVGADGVKAAVRAFHESPRPISLLVSDVVLADGSGPEVVSRLREADRRLPVVYVSGHTAGILEERGVPEHDQVVRKPFAVEELLGAMASALDHAHEPSSEPEQEAC